MNDMSQVIIPKSDQINADDLLAGPMTITIRDVQISGGQEQPVSIFFDGSDKAFRPCKSMSRVLVQGWGADAKAYIGRALTLYRDPEVKWGGMAVGGIRISHMSHIDGVKTMILTATKGSRKPHKVMPIEAPQLTATEDKAKAWADKLIATLASGTPGDNDALIAKHSSTLDKLQTDRPELHALVMAAAQKSAPGADDPFADDQPASTKFADGILADLAKVETVIDLDALFAKAAPHLVAMDQADADTIRRAFDAKRGKLAA